MNEEMKKALEKYAEERANEVEDIDMGELISLVEAGAQWVIDRQESNEV